MQNARHIARVPRIIRGGLAGLAAAVALGAGGLAHAWPGAPFAPTPPLAQGQVWSIAETWDGRTTCGRQEPETMGLRLAPFVQGGGVSANIVGFRLQDQSPEAISAFRTLTRGLDKAIRKRKAQPVVSDCRDVSCAAVELFGPEAGPRLLVLAIHYRFDASELGGRAERAWKPYELDDMLAALGDLPPEWFPMDGRGYRLWLYRDYEARTRVGEGPNGAADLIAIAGEGYPGILVASGWRRLSDVARRATLVHELAHEYARTRKWRAGWSKAMKADRRLGGLTSVSAYADTAPDEDFAESVVAYRYMPDLLRRRAPARYAWLRDRVFDGLEYGDPLTCGQRYAQARPTQIADGR